MGLEILAFVAVLVFLGCQVPPILGVFSFRAYVARQLAEESRGTRESISRAGDFVVEEPAHNTDSRETLQKGSVRRDSLQNSRWFYLRQYIFKLGGLLKKGRILSFSCAVFTKFPWRLYSTTSRRSLLVEYTPKASVVLPCKGIDPGFEKNLRSLVEQDYPDFELIFVVAEENDPAAACIRKVIQEYPEAKTQFVVAGIDPDKRRSQKLNNQLAAVKKLRPNSEAFVFVDSDIRARPYFLRCMIEPLGQPNSDVGATTGFRWYIPETGGLGSCLRTIWNGGGLPVMGQRNLAYTWGGAMATTRANFEKAGIAKRWETALTDDFPMTDGVRKLDKSIHFVPRCLVASHEDKMNALIEHTFCATMPRRFA